ncbi:mannonate dehydratase [Thalassobius sp. MITS945101]|uniref:mannonate dehydratase n=1 Tax=Thalassobius sp. MITS945101 TaxID=3096994 RepID=UPI00399A8687
MKETWRWYGPLDQIQLSEIRQTGAAGIVTALHEIPYGEVWQRDTIAERRSEIKAAGFEWDVVESLPLHEDIKRGTGDLASLFANYRQSMANLAAEGVHTICYNFMPLLDWTRTELNSPVANGGTCLRFSAFRMAAFEIGMLGRAEAENDYPTEVIAKAREWFSASSDKDQKELLNSIMSGMPGAYDRYDIEGLQRALDTYRGMDAADIRANYQRFLNEVISTAQDLGMRMCVHPDDPPRDILGLPRIVSDADDIAWIMGVNDAPANGLTLCSGSLGANPANDVVEIARTYSDRIHFAHIRNVRKDPDGSFEEAEHLSGDTDIPALCRILLGEEKARKSAGHPDWKIPFRPDHGHELLSDPEKKTFPGYPLIGRLRGLAEIRGVLHALSA